jgi:carboxyl-terminal processing protease
MFHKGKLLVFMGSLIIVLYGAAAAFYGKVVAEEAYPEIAVFTEALHRVYSEYVEEPDMNKVQEGAMRGLIDALDPYSSFLTKEQYDALQKTRAEGIASAGMIISKRSDVVYVVSCERDGPAATMGIRPGDYLVSVNGQQVEDKSILAVESLLLGAPGSKIKVEIFRSSMSKPLELELALKIPSPVRVESRITAENIAFLDVSSLVDPSVKQIESKLRELVSAGAQKLVLDLRDCADGGPVEGAGLANFFLQDGIIYYSQNRLGEKVQVVESSPDKYITDIPLVVLINGSTAAGAEITAGALKDRRRAKIVGEKSFGLGSAQKTISLKSGAKLILSTAKFCTPSGKVIQDETIRDAGIFPDVNVPDNETRQDLVVESYYDDQDEGMKYRLLREKIDQIQTEKALEVLAEDELPLKEAA